MLVRLRAIDFDVSKKNPKSVCELFKGLYMSFVPAAMRYALGKYYTPDWLASYVMDVAGWDIRQAFLGKTTPRLIQEHDSKSAVKPPFPGGFFIFGGLAA